MTTAALAPQPTIAPTRARAWAKRVGEFLVVGGATPLLFLMAWCGRRILGAGHAEYTISFTWFYLAYVINDPHFAVTYILFYKDVRARAFGDAFSPVQRARYIAAGFLAPAVMILWATFALATENATRLGYLIQTMYLLVGWHYVKQGFGVFSVLAARRGVRFSPMERFAILAHCYAGWAYAWASPADPGTDVEEKGVVFRTIARTHLLERATLVLCLATALFAIVVLVRKRLREGKLPIVTPLTALVCSIWPWLIFSGLDPLAFYGIPALHSIQYLYFVGLLKRNEARDREGPPNFEMSARARLAILTVSALGLGLLLFHLAPTFLDEALVPKSQRDNPGPLGATPYFAALYTFVNIHHYVMDSVIWRRDNPLTRYLAVR